MSETAKSSASKDIHVGILRSQLGRARGLGSAKSGTAVWWAERVTSIALVLLTLWFVLAVFHLEGGTRAHVAHWAAHPVNATLLLALVVATFHHMQLGLQVVIEDYVHGEPAHIILILANKAAAALLGIAAGVAVLKLAFTG
jgi:succinate dehydrogenase / fumarate reductase, membrane anchor subunit